MPAGLAPGPGPRPRAQPAPGRLAPTSCWVLSVLLHSSLRFSSSERSTLSHRRWVAPPGSSLPRPGAPGPTARPREGLRLARARAAAASPMLGSSPASGSPSARLYSAHRFRMVSRRWRSWKGGQSRREQTVLGPGGCLDPGLASCQEQGRGRQGLGLRIKSGGPWPRGLGRQTEGGRVPPRQAGGARLCAPCPGDQRLLPSCLLSLLILSQGGCPRGQRDTLRSARW